jgi:hypothetical protein
MPNLGFCLFSIEDYQLDCQTQLHAAQQYPDDPSLRAHGRPFAHH